MSTAIEPAVIVPVIASDVVTAAPAMRAIDQIRAALQRSLQHITVEEWGGLTLYFAPMVPNDMTAVEEAVDDSTGATLDRNIKLLIHMARDKDGKPAFAPGDFHYLKTEARLGAVQRVITFMFNAGVLSQAAATGAVKN